jgi:hypothetical protein
MWRLLHARSAAPTPSECLLDIRKSGDQNSDDSVTCNVERQARQSSIGRLKRDRSRAYQWLAH